MLNTTEQPYYGSTYRINANTSSFNRGNINYFPKIEGKDKYTPKYKAKKDYSTLKTIGLVLLTAFGVYKGRNLIGKATSGISSGLKKCVDSCKGKFPNLSQACASFKEACKAPAKPFIAVGNFCKSLAGKVGDFFGKIFKKAK